MTLDELTKFGRITGLAVRFFDRNADKHVSRSIFVLR